MATSDLFLNEIKAVMPLVMVRKAMLAAAGGTDAQHIVDRIDKVELRTVPLPSSYSMQLRLTIWWKLEDSEFHITERQTTVEDGRYITHEEVLEEILDFKPEDALKFAAYF